MMLLNWILPVFITCVIALEKPLHEWSFNNVDLNQYEGYLVVRFEQAHDTIYRELHNRGIFHYQVWGSGATFTDLKLSFEDVMKLRLPHEVIIEDLPSAIAATYPEKTVVAEDFSVQKEIFFKEFRDLETIYAWLDLMQGSFPDLVRTEWVGQTFEGRDMKALRISSPHGHNEDKKTIVITGGVHAREWISVSTVCYIIYELLVNYGKKSRETKYLDGLDFLIIPVFNPDGYEYTWTHDRLWRKNRQQTYLPRCFGIDIDHSFDFHWTKSEDFPCGESYSGESPFEALEADTWNNYLNATKGDQKIHGYLDFHSYSQEILYPYAYSCEATPRDLENLLELSYGLAKAIRSKSGKYYQVMSACQDRGSDLLPGLGSGSALDYMYHMRAYWAFQLKLRDNGSRGFLLPSKSIIPVGKESYAALKYFCEFILDPDL